MFSQYKYYGEVENFPKVGEDFLPYLKWRESQKRARRNKWSLIIIVGAILLLV